ncbi:MAG: HPP family protein [Actinomycetales bacterium]
MSATHLGEWLGDARVKDVMSRQVLTVEESESLWDAWQLLFVSGMHHLVVLDEDGDCLGILSDRGILAEIPATAEHLDQRQVRDVLARVAVISVHPEDAPQSAGRLMVAHDAEAVPVVDHQGRVIGVVTEADLIRWIVG